MALQVGVRRSTFKEPEVKFPSPVPCMTYDGDPPWPILVKSPEKVAKNLRWCCVDNLGMRLHPSWSDDFVFELKDPEAYIKAMTAAQTKYGITPGIHISDKNIFWEIKDEANRILWPQVQEVIKPMRVEMERLNQAWVKSV
jgi:hypothetical protein